MPDINFLRRKKFESHSSSCHIFLPPVGTEGPSKEIREGKTEYRGSLVPRDDTSSESENEDSDNENKEFLDFQL